MDRDTAVNLIGRRLGFRTDKNSEIIETMQFMQETELEGDPSLPWFLIKEDATLATAADTETVTPPTDFLDIPDKGGLWYLASTGKWAGMGRGSIDDLRSKHDVSGTPEAYDLVGETLYIAPVPDAIYSLRLMYLGRALDLTTNIENLWLKYASDWMIATVLEKMATDLQMQDLARTAGQQKLIARARVIKRSIAIEESDREDTMGDE